MRTVKNEKYRKNFLTKGHACGIIIEYAAQRGYKCSASGATISGE